MRVPVVEQFYETIGRVKVAYLEGARWHPDVLAYGGYGSETEARVLGRVLMTRTDSSRTWLTERRGWRQFLDTEVPRQPVLIQLGKATRIVEADIGGYLDVTLTGHGLGAGWHDALVHVINRHDMRRVGEALFEASLRQQSTARELAQHAHSLGVRLTRGLRIPIRIVGNNETAGIVSDVDDTIMVSMVPHKLLAVRYAFVDKVSSRQSVPGMSHFLHGLQNQVARDQAASPDGPPPFFFLSTGAWNTVPVLRQFLNRGGFPRATMLLRPWWITDHGFPSTGSAFKLSQFKKLVEMLPQVKWVLVGDNGQHDPEVFLEFSKRWPQKLAAVAIRSLLPREHFTSHGTTQERWRVEESDLPPGIPMIHGDDGYRLLEELRSPRVSRMLRARLSG